MSPFDPGDPADRDARDDRDRPAEPIRPIKLLQGYLWHPKDLEVDLDAHLPRRLDPDVRVLWDELPRAPFTFFDDGTPASTQRIYQFTVATYAEDEETAGRLTPWLAEVLQRALETTPAGVGWQIMEDLRPLG